MKCAFRDPRRLRFSEPVDCAPACLRSRLGKARPKNASGRGQPPCRRSRLKVADPPSYRATEAQELVKRGLGTGGRGKVTFVVPNSPPYPHTPCGALSGAPEAEREPGRTRSSSSMSSLGRGCSARANTLKVDDHAAAELGGRREPLGTSRPRTKSANG